MATTDRRRFLEVVLASGATALCTAPLAPAIAFVLPSGRGGEGGRWVKTLRLDALQEGVPRRVKIVADERDAWKLERNAELGGVWLVRTGDVVTALSVVCPHLGCSIGVTEDNVGSQQSRTAFACPCHESFFEASGKRQSGPSPRDMDALETRIVSDVVEVDFRRFRQGTPDRVEVG